jgi:class I fructose-bisphosphate aldolase
MPDQLTYNSVGKRIRLARILKSDGRAVVFAFDHGVEHGPRDFPPEHIDPRVIIGKVVEAGVDAIMMLPGMARLTWDIWGNKTALIVKVTSKTNLRPKEERLRQSVFGYVEEAVALGADAVAATVYWIVMSAVNDAIKMAVEDKKSQALNMFGGMNLGQ